jgi:short-subunit dehydrogenase involved in D-alanine esterification of teichoic acids
LAEGAAVIATDLHEDRLAEISSSAELSTRVSDAGKPDEIAALAQWIESGS